MSGAIIGSVILVVGAIMGLLVVWAEGAQRQKDLARSAGIEQPIKGGNT